MDTKRKPSHKRRIQRILKKKEPQIVEDTKQAMFIRGGKTSEVVNSVLTDLCVMKKPHSIVLNKKNLILPFEDSKPLEFFSEKNDAHLFVFGSHSKKRPNNLVFGRLFDCQILDMIEIGVENYKPLDAFEEQKPAVGHKPMMLFQGPEWKEKEDYKKLSNILIDMFKGEELSQVNLAGLEHVIVCTALNGKISFRVYRLKLKRSGTKIPRVELIEVGPAFDMTIRRTRFASEDLMHEALKRPSQLKKKKVKNISSDFMAVRGSLHMERQNLDEMALKRPKALRKRKNESDEGNAKKAKTIEE